MAARTTLTLSVGTAGQGEEGLAESGSAARYNTSMTVSRGSCICRAEKEVFGFCSRSTSAKGASARGKAYRYRCVGFASNRILVVS